MLKLFLIFAPILVFGIQEKADEDSIRFIFEPDSLYLHVGESAEITIRMVTADNKLTGTPFLIYGQPRRSLETYPRISDSTGFAKVKVKPYKPGALKLRTRSISIKREDRVYGELKITVPKPKLKRIVFNNSIDNLYEGTTVRLEPMVYDEANLIRDEVSVVLASSNSKVAKIDGIGNLVTLKSGNTTISATVDSLFLSIDLEVIKNPVRSLSLSSGQDNIRTGDVITFTAVAYDRKNRVVDDAPIQFSYNGKAVYGIGLPAAAQIMPDGRFVAETEGVYSISATSNGFNTSKRIKVGPRNISKDVELIGHGLISNVKTSDLWIWPGIGKHKGKDFAVTGTWGANGEAYFWDVSDPSDMKIIDTVTVDARTVNDVKISEDGRVGVISREGASNRKNGFVILNVSDPYNVEILSNFNDDMTGGVHNTFIYDCLLYTSDAADE